MLLQKPGFGLAKMATIYHKLMLSLGYNTYVGQGGDWGSFILRSIALQYPSHLIGLHINFVVTLPPSPLRNPITLFWLATRQFTPSEKKHLGRLQWFLKTETGYSKIQGTKPQTVSYGLLDSPVGMLAWIREKMQFGTEEDYVWDSDTVITWTMLYLISGSAGHARIYKEGESDTAEGTKAVLGNKISSDVALGVSHFPRDVGYATRWWADATMSSNIVMWREHESGGHFPSTECPDTLIEDVSEWIATVKKTSSSTKWDALLKAGE